MNKRTKQYGFSLTEVLLAVGVLAVGMIVVAGVYPTALYFATISTERTIASAVANEAFAKIRLYGISDANVISLPDDECIPYRVVDEDTGIMYDNTNTVDSPLRIYDEINNEKYSEYVYPTDSNSITGKDYCWSAICRRVVGSSVQVTVFVSRLVGAGNNYYWWNDESEEVANATAPLPEPVKVGVQLGSYNYELEILNDTLSSAVLSVGVEAAQFFSRGTRIIDDEEGIIYVVQEKYKGTNVIRLDKNWQGGSSGSVWVIPPPEGGGRRPCIGVYPRRIRF